MGPVSRVRHTLTADRRPSPFTLSGCPRCAEGLCVNLNLPRWRVALWTLLNSGTPLFSCLSTQADQAGVLCG